MQIKEETTTCFWVLVSWEDVEKACGGYHKGTRQLCVHILDLYLMVSRNICIHVYSHTCFISRLSVCCCYKLRLSGFQSLNL